MRMNRVLTFLAVSGVVTLAAQDVKPFSVGGAILSGTNDLKKVTNSGQGFSVHASYDTTFPNSDIPARISLGYHMLPGKETAAGLKTSLSNLQLAGDIHLRMPVENLSVTVGLSLNKYSATYDGTEKLDPTGKFYVAAFPIDTTKGMKFGGRFGLDYTFSPNLSSYVMLQLTELGNSSRKLGQNSGSYAQAVGPVNPSWVQVGVRYHFGF